MTQSQSIAKVFTFAGYIFIVPGFLAALSSILTLGFSPVIPFVAIFIFGFGVCLLIGYRRHSRGYLSREKIIPLWVGTFVYNLLFFVPQVWIAIRSENFSDLMKSSSESEFIGAIFFSIAMWQLVAILLATYAIFDVVITNRNNGNVP
jgi:hypothetical protein